MFTGNRDDEEREASLVSPGIQVLAESCLSPSEATEASGLCRMFFAGEQDKKRAGTLVLNLAPMRPKRPLSYAVRFLRELPEEARTSMKYFGDYVDMLVKSWAEFATGDPRSQQRSLGMNLDALSRSLHPEPEFLDQLELYDEAVYVPAKHDFELPPDRSVNRFTATEALLTAGITMRLSELVSVHHAQLLTEGATSKPTSVSALIVDPLSRVLLVRNSAEAGQAYDVPRSGDIGGGPIPSVALGILEELTSRKGRIIRCLGLYERPKSSGLKDEMAFVVKSPYVPQEEVQGSATWLPTNDVHSSLILDSAKKELDRFL